MDQVKTLETARNGATAPQQPRRHIMNPEAPEHVPRRAGHTSRRGSTPPTAPKAMLESSRRRRATNQSLNRKSRHTIEAQQYWTRYPSSISSSSPSSFNSSRPSTSAVPSSSPSASCVRATQEHQQRLSFLPAHLARLQAQVHCIAQTYRNFGLLFYSFPSHVVWDDAIRPDIRTFGRSSFTVRGGYPLPEMVHLVGTLSHVIGMAAERLQKICVPETEVLKVMTELLLAERLVAEGVAKLGLLRQAIEVFGCMRTILLMQQKKEWEVQHIYARRMKFYHAWAHALPMLCWEGLREEDRKGLQAARRAAMGL